jgi:hypothetical protein
MRIDQLTRTQLVLLAQYLGIGLHPYLVLVYPTFALKRQLRVRIRSLRADDKDIFFEGVGNLSEGDLYDSCAKRGLVKGVGAAEKEVLQGK